MDWEFEFLHWITESRNDFLTGFGKVLTFLGDKGIFWILLCAVLVIIPKTRKIGIYAGAALVIQLLLGEVLLKHIIQRERPFVQDTTLTTIIPVPTGKYSFPSGHTSSSFAVAVSVFLHNKKMGVPLIFAAFMIMLSRLYFCVHFPTDVMAGLALGVAVAVAVFFMMSYLLKKHGDRFPWINNKGVQ